MSYPRAIACVLLTVSLLTPAPGNAQELENHLRLHLEGAAAGERATVGGEPLHHGEVLLSIYQRRGWQPIWSDAGVLGRAGQELFVLLARLPSHGLSPGAYHEHSLIGATLAPAPGTPERLADLDLLLSDAFLRLGSDLATGRVRPEALESDWIPTRLDFDPEALLAEVEAGMPLTRHLESLLPREAGYDRLREALLRYRAIVASDGWPTDFDEQTELASRTALVERLFRGGDLETAEGASDEEIEEALRRFQHRHGLPPTGQLDTATRRELAISARQRLQQIVLNLERWRWLPRSLGRPHVRVDVPDSTLSLVSAGEESTMKVVVGTAYRRTPVFSDTIRYLVFNPVWHVPHNIAVRDKLPKIQQDPGYLERQGMRVFTDAGADAVEVDPDRIDWTALGPDRFPYRLRQEPGPLNALGRVKFMFPNRFNVYLHDTPERDLFERQNREASSGCIRLERPIELAERLLAGQEGWDRERIEATIRSGRETTVMLEDPVPVHLLYFTAWADRDGTVHFRPDLYDRDRRLAAALERRR